MTKPHDTQLRPVTGSGTTSNTEAIDYALWVQNEALRLFSVLGHWDCVAQALASHLKLSGAAWWMVSKGERITDAKINALRAHAGLPPMPEKKLATVCPSCLTLGIREVHGEGLDCHGAPVVQVVCLASGQTIVNERKNGHTRPRPRYLRPCLSLEPRTRVAQLERLLEVAEQEIIDRGGEP